jgi:hypothetical protein
VTTRAPEFTQAGTAAPRRANRWLGWGLAALAIAVLYVVYWRESWSAAANSDSAAIALQAWDVLHGNLLLHGWWMSDVSFYTTEVPQYALLEIVGGLGPWVVHAAAAMTYTLIVVLVALLARGSGVTSGVTGREGWARAVLGGLIAASPQVSGALIFLLGPDHTGTVVPVLATWLFIDLVRPRWYVPVIVGVLLTWIMVADSVVLFTGIAPLIVAGVVRAVRPRRPGQRSYELSLAAAAAVAAVLGTLIPKLIVRLGGFQVWHFQTHTMPFSALPHDSWDTIQAVLELFGADVFGTHPFGEQVLCAFHFAGVILAIVALGIALWRFFREDGILVPGLAVAIGLELGAFLVSIHSQNLASIREIAAVMPLGAVLAGRLLAGPLLRWFGTLAAGWRGVVAAVAPVLVAVLVAVVVAAYLAAMGYGAAQPSVPSANQALASWLSARHLTDGLAAYWQAGSVTLDTGGAVTVGSVVVDRDGKLGPRYWETQTSDYAHHLRDTRFVIAGGPKADVPIPGLAAAAIRTFGPPAHVYHVGQYTVLTWNR